MAAVRRLVWWCASLAIVTIVHCGQTGDGDKQNAEEYPDIDYYGDYNLSSLEFNTDEYVDHFMNSINTSELVGHLYSNEYDNFDDTTETTDEDESASTSMPFESTVENDTELTSGYSSTDNDNIPTTMPFETTVENNGDNYTDSDIDLENDIILDHENAQVLHSPGYPEPYPANYTWTWNFAAGEGYGLEINVTDLDLDVITSDYVVINPGGGERNEESLIFNGFLSNPRRFRILGYDSVTVQLVSNIKEENTSHRGFSMSIKHIGIQIELEVTTLDPTPNWISSPADNHTIFLSGMSPKKFLDVSEDFRKILTDMVYYFIDEHSITVMDNVTIEDRVSYQRIAACNINWPSTETCISVMYAVPLYYNKTNGEYVMTRENMTIMWDSLSTQDFYMQEMKLLGLTIYHLPNDNAILTWWVAISLGVIVLMLIFTYLIWRFNCFDEYIRMKEFSDSESHMSKKISNDSLFPTPHQTFPPLFNMDSYDELWSDQTLPPNYDESYIGKEDKGSTSLGGYDNKTFTDDDNLFFGLETDEGIMSLPDNVPNNADGSKPGQTSL